MPPQLFYALLVGAINGVPFFRERSGHHFARAASLYLGMGKQTDHVAYARGLFFFPTTKEGSALHHATLQSLQVPQAREQLASFAACQLGKELALAIQPLATSNEMEMAQAETTEAKVLLRQWPGVPFGGIQDVRLYVRRVDQGGVLRPEQLMAVADTLYGCHQLHKYLKERAEMAPRLAMRAALFGRFDKLEEAIRGAIEHGTVSSRASQDLKHVRKEIAIVEGRIQDRLQSMLKQFHSHLQEALITRREGRYVLPVKASSRGAVPGAVHGASASGATIFVEPEAIRALCDELDYWRAMEEAEVEKVLMALSAEVALQAEPLLATLTAAAELDFIFAKGRLSYAWDAGPVTWNNEGRIDLKGARHPLLGRDAVGNRIRLLQDQRLLIVTGPNTGGKTLLLKTLGLLVVLAQSGLHIPVEAESTLCRFGNVFADIGDSQSLEQSLSTFSGHIANVAPMLEAAGPTTLVLLDELGAGTDPHEGTGLGIALLEAFMAKGAYTLATTHLREIKEFGRVTKGATTAGMGFDAETLRPTYRLIYGAMGESHGLIIAARAGLPATVVERAHELLYGEVASYGQAATVGVADRAQGRLASFRAVPTTIPGVDVPADVQNAAANEPEPQGVDSDLALVLSPGARQIRIYHQGEEREVTLKGALLRKYPSGLVVGDRVELDGEQVVAVAKRASYLARRQVGDKLGEQVIAANLTRLLIVLSARQPDFRPAVLDRHLVYAEQYGISPIICLTKADLVREGAWQQWLRPYDTMGYATVVTSTARGWGLERLRHLLAGHTTAVLGHSGVGKSSLLGALTGSDLAVGAVRESGAKTGRHTTTAASAIRLDESSWVIDTPGLRELGFYKLNWSDLQAAFREFGVYVNLCKFRGCTHLHEPSCGVKLAVKQGQIDPRRYDQYAKLAREVR